MTVNELSNYLKQFPLNARVEILHQNNFYPLINIAEYDKMSVMVLDTGVTGQQMPIYNERVFDF